MTDHILISLLAGAIIGAALVWVFRKIMVEKDLVPLSRLRELETELTAARTSLALERQQLDQHAGEIQRQDNLLKNWELRYETLFKSNESFAAQADGRLQRMRELQEELQQAQLKLSTRDELVSDLKEALAQRDARLDTQREQLEAQKKNLEEMGLSLKKDFELLAGSILEEKTKKFTESNCDNLKTILDPLKKDLSEFKQKVESAYNNEARERFSLGEKIKDLIGLNQRISEEANNLTKALKGEVKKQGDWGEMILESILEHSGLVKDREYFLQEFIRDAAGNIIKNEEGQGLKPDVMVYYPDKRCLVMDSKVSLVAYERFASAEDKADQERELNAHILSIKTHIDGLSKKNYQHFVGSLDWVVLFIPIEPAYLVALRKDPQLWNYAYSKKIILVCPSNLLAVLKITADLWKREHQSQHAAEIAKRGGQLYDKLAGFVQTMDVLGDSLKKASSNYDKAYAQLSTGPGNLIRQAEMMRELGIKTSKRLPECSE